MSMIRRNLKRRAAQKAALLAKEPEKKEYTKTEINRMSTAELKQMALERGLENADSMTGVELKKYFFDVFEL